VAIHSIYAGNLITVKGSRWRFSAYNAAEPADTGFRLARTAGFHAALPNMNLVQRMAIGLLHPRFDSDLDAWPAHRGIVNLAKKA
jgi:hypothetical protein